MSDTAEALRQFPWVTDTQQHLAARAADEITRLRARVRELEGQHKGLVIANAVLRQRRDLPVDRIPVADDVLRLRAQNAELEKHRQLMAMEDAGYAVIKRLTDENAGLRAQNAGLLEALQRFACTCDRVGNAECSSGEVDCPFWNARAAIAKAEGHT